MVDDKDDDVIFVNKEWVCKNLGISLAKQERLRSVEGGSFPRLVVMSDDPYDPQAHVGYYKAAVKKWAFTRPERPRRFLKDLATSPGQKTPKLYKERKPRSDKGEAPTDHRGK